MRLKKQVMPEQRVVRTGIITLDDIRKKFNLPQDAEVSVRIPGGANWSGLDANIGDDIPHLSVRVERAVDQRHCERGLPLRASPPSTTEFE